MRTENAGYLAVSDDFRVLVTAVYRAIRENAGLAHVSLNTGLAHIWRIYPGNQDVTWDGVALVNAGPEPTAAIIHQKDSEGTILESQSFS